MQQALYMELLHSIFTMASINRIKMKKRMWLIIGSISVLVIVGYYAFYDHLLPRTPLKIARNQSGLDIPNDIQIVNFKEEYSFNGEGFIYVLLKLDEKNMNSIIEKCIKQKYIKLNIENLINDKLIHTETKKYGYKIYDRDISSIQEGYYKLNAIDLDKLDFSITVIDVQKKELMIYISIP